MDPSARARTRQRSGTSIAGLVLLVATPAVAAAQAREPAPLFASDEPLTLVFLADFNAIRRDRSDDPQDRPARLVLPAGDTMDVEVRPRGNFRRDPVNCSFPPLRLDVRTNRARETVFEGQDKLKMVVPCRPDRDTHEAYVLREYLLYRVYGVITPLSFTVRLARITFVDTSGRSDPFTRFAFFIESAEGLGARSGAEVLDIPEGKIVRASQLHPDVSTRVALFQYMIGNTDWADARVHNVAFVGLDGRAAPVPYDFDHAGAVDATYAAPMPDLPISNVRQRFYQGWCWPDQDRDLALRPFHDARPRIEGLLEAFPYLDAREKASLGAYLAEFYQVVETPERAHQRMFRDCRRLP